MTSIKQGGRNVLIFLKPSTIQPSVAFLFPNLFRGFVKLQVNHRMTATLLISFHQAKRGKKEEGEEGREI